MCAEFSVTAINYRQDLVYRYITGEHPAFNLCPLVEACFARESELLHEP